MKFFMNKLLILLNCFLLFISIYPAAAAGRDQILGPDELQAIFMDIIQADIPARIEDIQVSDFSSRPERIILPPGKISYQPTRKLSGQLSPGKKFITVTVNIADKKSVRIKMYGTVHFFNTVVITSAPLPRHKKITEDDINTDFREVSYLADNFIDLPDLAIGKELKRSLGKGSVLYQNFLKNPALVKRGDMVTIIAANHGVKVTTPGKVKNTGGMGEMVRVKNLTSRRTIQARVIGKGMVQVDL
jgi:flagella basal body P-ring formation protein FlgA